MIATYLVHHGYCATAEAFARSTGQEFGEEVASIKNRQSEFLHPFIASEDPHYMFIKSKRLDVVNLNFFLLFQFYL